MQRYNFVVFQTISVNEVDFLVINEVYLSTRGGWKMDYRNFGHVRGGDQGREYYQTIQDTHLDSQYLNRSRFEIISAVDCYNRYTAAFIRAGNGFAVVPTGLAVVPTIIFSNENYYNSSLLYTDSGSARFEGLTRGLINSTDFLCKSIRFICCASFTC
jgi:hypothetical protein